MATFYYVEHSIISLYMDMEIWILENLPVSGRIFHSDGIFLSVICLFI